jgi:uncharacterized protein YuzE
MSRPGVTIEIDTTTDAAYISLTDAPVARTVELSDDILVDVDSFGVVVGVEVLRLGAEIPFRELTDALHVHSDVIDILKEIQPSISGMLSLTQASDGTTSTVTHGEPQYA